MRTRRCAQTDPHPEHPNPATYVEGPTMCPGKPEGRVATLEAENAALKALLNKAYSDQCGCLGGTGAVDAP